MKPWLIAVAVAHALDVSTSCAAFARGGVEGNPALPTSCQVQIPIQAGIAGVQLWAINRLAQDGHPRAAKVVASVQIGFSVGVSAHNWTVGR
jgi:hypothetical protein